jgi:hypothetical protein
MGRREGEREVREEVPLCDSGRALLVPFSWTRGGYFSAMTEEKRNDVQLHF